MNKDEEIRINATIAELTGAIVRATHRAADLAAECASLRAQVEALTPKPAKPDLQVVEASEGA